MAYTVTDGTTIRDVLEWEITESTNELDSCAFLTDGEYTDNDDITVYDGASAIFTGVQKSSEQRDDVNVMYDITALEKAVEMQYVIMSSGGLTTYTTSGNVNTLIDSALSLVNTAYGTSWSRGSSHTATSYTVSCYYTNALSFIKKVIIDNLGYKLWFDSATQKVYFGQYNTDRSATAISYLSKRTIRDSNKRKCNKVIVIGNNSSITGSAGTGNLIRVFECLELKSSTECTNLATNLLADFQNASVQYELQLLYTTACEVADKIDVDGTDVVVTKMVTTPDRKVVTAGTEQVSILDQLAGRITEISGETVAGTDAQWSGGNTNVAANGAAYTTYTFDIKDVGMVTNAKLDATIGSFIKSADVTASTSYLSDVSNVRDSSSIGGTSLDATYTYVPDSNGVAGGTMSNGYQFGMIILAGSVRNTHSTQGGTIFIRGQIKIGSGSWASIPSAEYEALISPLTSAPITMSVLFDGQTSSDTTYVRWRVWTDGAGTMSTPDGFYIYMQRVPRHIHTVTTTYDKTTTGTPPSTVSVHINSGTDQTLTPGTPLTLSGAIGTLVTGKNTIYVKTPAGSGNQCSVNPTITYQTLGKSA